MAAKALKCFGHELRIEDNPVRMALNFEVRGKRKIKGTQKANRNFRYGVILATFVDRDTTGLKQE